MNVKVLASLGVIVALLAGLMVITVINSNKVTVKSVASANTELYRGPVAGSDSVQAPQVVTTTLNTQTKDVKTSLQVKN